MNSIDAFRKFADTTEYLHVGSGVFTDMKKDFRNFIQGKPVFLVADENTMAAAGNSFAEFCGNENIHVVGWKVFPAEPELDSDYGHIEELVALLGETVCFPVAIGSGTINDLVKRAAHELEYPYAVLATACSVDGYASDGAAILYRGLKQTLPCKAPVFICADTEVLCSAPSEMTSAGYADLLAKNPAGADWIIADTLDLDPIDSEVWSMIQGNLPLWTSNPSRLAEGDREAFARLFTGLNATGFAMQYMKKSRPASGAEHLLSHIWEMEGHMYRGKHVSHGFKVALGSLASIALMESVLSFHFGKKEIKEALNRWQDQDTRLEKVRDFFSGTGALDDLLEINRIKHATIPVLEQRLEEISRKWEILKEKTARQLIPYGEYRELLRKAGCPIRPEDIGLTVKKVLDTFRPAQMMRDRYTILDLAEETGLMEKALGKMEKSRLYLK